MVTIGRENVGAAWGSICDVEKRAALGGGKLSMTQDSSGCSG